MQKRDTDQAIVKVVETIYFVLDNDKNVLLLN